MYIRDDGPDDQAGEKPHEGHADAEDEGERAPFALDVFPGQLDAGQNELNAENDAGEVVGDEVEVLARQVGIFKGSDEVRDEGGEDDASKSGKNCLRISDKYIFHAMPGSSHR